MSFVADACALIAFWAEAEPDRVMPRGAPVLRNSDVAVHPITVWEITQKIAAGKLLWPQSLPPLSGLLRRENLRVLTFTWEDAEMANALPWLHKDPMDRMLIASAKRDGLTVITSDTMFPRYGVATIW